MADLKAQGNEPQEPDDRDFDSDDYPKHAGNEGGGEADTCHHCAGCGVPLENSLTSDGVNHVLEAMRESLQEAVDGGRATTWDRIMPLKGTGEETMTYWHGSRHVEIVRGWAEQIQGYMLEKDESALVILFLELSEKI